MLLRYNNIYTFEPYYPFQTDELHLIFKHISLFYSFVGMSSFLIPPIIFPVVDETAYHIGKLLVHRIGCVCTGTICSFIQIPSMFLDVFLQTDSVLGND